MGQELFEILDANQDKILNSNDREYFVANAEKNRVLIDNKVSGICFCLLHFDVRTQDFFRSSDYREITFDMRIRVAGAMDFTLPEEDVESMIVSLTKRDLEMWSQKHSKIELHDEL